MFHLIYISTASPGTDAATIEQILATSRRRNPEEGLSGLLIHDGVRFMQYLEGEEGAVRAAFARIKADPRHRACVVLREGRDDARKFAAWAMADRTASAPAEFDSLKDQVEAAVAGCDATTAAHLLGFAAVRGS